jgi:hypothetical protein
MSDDTKKVEALIPRPPEFDGTRKLDLLKAPTAGLVAMLRAARRAEHYRRLVRQLGATLVSMLQQCSPDHCPTATGPADADELECRCWEGQ